MAVAPAAAQRPRPGGGRLFIIVGLLVAILGAGGLFFVSTLIGGGGGGGGGPTTKVVTAASNIPLRHQLVAGDLTLTAVSGTNVNVFTNIKDAETLVTQIAITKGEIITADMLVKDPGLVTGAAVQYLPLATGYVAMTIPSSEQQGVAGNIAVGDYITMVASASVSIFQTTPVGGTQQVGPPKFVVKTIFTNIHVIRLGPTQPPAPAANGASSATTSTSTGQQVGVTSSLTIAVTQCQAEYITWFLANTTVRYTLEAFPDYLKTPPTADSLGCGDVTKTPGVTNVTIDKIFHFTSVA